MGTRADYVSALAAVVTAAGEELVAVLDRPVSPLPGSPAVMVTPGVPYLAASGPGTYQIRLDVVLFAGRLDTETVMSQLDKFLPLIRSAAPEAELRYIQTQVGVESVAGVEYVTARSALEGETRSP